MLNTVYIVLRHSNLETNGNIYCIFSKEEDAIRYTRSMNDKYAENVILNDTETDLKHTPENDDVLSRTCNFCYYNYEVHRVDTHVVNV